MTQITRVVNGIPKEEWEKTFEIWNEMMLKLKETILNI